MSHHHQPNRSHTPSPMPSDATSKPCACGASNCSCPPNADRVRARAYEISLARNGGPGDAKSDWSKAEGELRDSGRGSKM